MLFAFILSSCGGNVSERELEEMSNDAKRQIFQMYSDVKITAYGIKCSVEDICLENDTTARGRLVIEFDDWSKNPSPKVSIQAFADFVKLHNTAWRLRKNSLDIFLSISQQGTELNENDSTYILPKFTPYDNE